MTDYSIDYVFSKDGTMIHYYQLGLGLEHSGRGPGEPGGGPDELGRGPGIVLLHGSMESARSHLQLARALSDTFTVYLPERRGHHPGGSEGYTMQKEIEDLDALLIRTGSSFVFGVSSGGLIALEAARILRSVTKIAVYEPALIVQDSVSTSFLARYEQEIADGKTAAALVTAMKGAKLGPQIFNLIPRRWIESLTEAMMKKEDKTVRDVDITMRQLAPTLRYDFQLITEMAESLDTFSQVHCKVLLLSGSKSPAWLRSALAPLEMVLPYVKWVRFTNLDHGGSSDKSSTNRKGRPDLVAEEMRSFFL